MYSIERAEKVFKMVATLVETCQSNTSDFVMIVAPPPLFTFTIAVVFHFFDGFEKSRKVFQCLSDLKSFFSSERTSLFSDVNDHLDFVYDKEKFRRFIIVGLDEFKSVNLLEMIELFEKMLKFYSEAAASGCFVE